MSVTRRGVPSVVATGVWGTKPNTSKACKCWVSLRSTQLTQLKNQIVNVLRLLADDPFTPSLKSHKLTGDLAGLWSGSVTYDCRIIFNFSEDEKLLEMISSSGNYL
ncbi:type II toxin-antitoxin system YoeB family toxin [Nostoc sp. CHAB 5844]|nr:type II toxin-antitoxin system YoeB family toxin [Nostoc sp. CHAB 5844]